MSLRLTRANENACTIYRGLKSPAVSFHRSAVDSVSPQADRLSVIPECSNRESKEDPLVA